MNDRILKSRHQAAVDAFRHFLDRRGRSDWPVAKADEIRSGWRHAIDAAIKAGPDPELTWLDPVTGAERPVLYNYNRPRRRLDISQVAVLHPDRAFYFFALEEEDLSQTWFKLVAAPDLCYLEVVLNELGFEAADRARDADECIVIGEDPIRINRWLDWDDIVLPEATVKDIRENVERFVNGRETYRALGVPYKRGFLFTGPPGNGKTSLCRVIVARTGYPCVTLICSDQGSLNVVHEAFEEAGRLAPCVLLFEDLDRLFRNEGQMSTFLNLMDGFRTRQGVLTLATTNYPEELDGALVSRPSRFDRVWRIGDPETGCRRRYLAERFEGRLAAGEVEELVAETEGFSFAYLQELYVSTALAAAHEGAERIDLEAALAALERLREQQQSARRRYDVETLGFGRPE